MLKLLNTAEITKNRRKVMQLEVTGKNVEIAIQNGLLECGMKREDVDVKVLDEGSLFKKAKVILSWGEKEEKVEEIDTKEEQVETSAQPADESKEDEPIEETIQPAEKPKKLVDTSRLQAKVTEFLTGLTKMIDETATVECEAKENELNFSIHGQNLGKLIGFHGDNLSALQMLLSGLKTKGEGAVRIYLDVDGYKANKNQSLIDLANKTADQAVKIERNIHLDPMNAYERRIIHTTIQERDDCTTESTGEGEKRHVVVKPVFKK